jgi:hypothetical protein
MNAYVYEMVVNGVDQDDIDAIMSKLEGRLSGKRIDAELEKLGYERIFDDEEDSSETDSFEHIKRKKEMRDD